jgi:hypothetical protein
MSIEDLQFLQRLLKRFLDSDGDLPDKRVEKTRQLVLETLEDSDPDGGKTKDF